MSTNFIRWFTRIILIVGMLLSAVPLLWGEDPFATWWPLIGIAVMLVGLVIGFVFVKKEEKKLRERARRLGL